ncbi:MAG: hypothetical protein H7Y18_15865 [Clostridiaceae bacterium]|nr:hypothetical protein [Clostridiaceae bacterium]
MFYTLAIVLKEPILLSMISATAIITGSILGATCSWIVTKKSLIKNEEIQTKLAKETREFQDHKEVEIVKDNAAIIRLDICTVLFQSIKTLRISGDQREKLYTIPMNHDYSRAVASLQKNFELRELSYIYQLYGIIEKLNYDIKNLKYFNEEDYKLIIRDYEILLQSLYGDNYKEILKLNIKDISYEELWNNEYIKIGYKNVLGKLNKVCDLGSL